MTSSQNMDEAKQKFTNDEGWALVRHEETESLLQMLYNSLPETLHIYNFIKCSFLWSASYPDVNTAIFHKLCNGQTSVIATVKAHELILSAYSLNGSDIASALKGDNVINWSEGSVLLSCIPKKLCPTIEEAILLFGKDCSKNDTFNAYWLPAYAAKTIDIQCPEDMYLSKLEPSHAATVAHHWPYAKGKSLFIVTQMVNALDTVGLFTKKDSVLVSWVLNTFYGVGMLHTIDEYRRKGYGRIVVQHLVKSLGNRGINPTILTLPANHAAESLFMKIGFKKLEPVKFMRVM